LSELKKELSKNLYEKSDEKLEKTIGELSDDFRKNFGEKASENMKPLYLEFYNASLQRQEIFIKLLEDRLKKERAFRFHFRLNAKIKKIMNAQEDIDYAFLNRVEVMLNKQIAFANEDNN